MDDLHRKNDEQLNISDQTDFTVEDIVKEFGSEPQIPEEELKIWTPKPKPAPPAELEESEEVEESETLSKTSSVTASSMGSSTM